MTQPLTPTQADISAASELICDQSLCDCEICMAKFSQAFARHAQAARLEGARAMQRAAENLVDDRAEVCRMAGVAEGFDPIEAQILDEYLSKAANSIASLDPLSIAEKGV